MDLGLDGRRALVFGSSSGLGRAVAAALVAEGARVAVVSRDHDRAGATAGEIGAARRARRRPHRDRRRRDGVVADAVAALGGLDICRRQHRWRHARADPVDRRSRRRGVPRRCCARCSRSAAPPPPHVTAGGDGRLVYLTARSVVEASARAGAELGVPQRCARRGPVAGDRAGARARPSTSSSPVSSTRRRWLASRRHAPATRVAAVDEVRRRAHRRRSRWAASARPTSSPTSSMFLCSARASFVTGAVVPRRRRRGPRLLTTGSRSRPASGEVRVAGLADVGAGDRSAAGRRRRSAMRAVIAGVLVPRPRAPARATRCVYIHSITCMQSLSISASIGLLRRVDEQPVEPGVEGGQPGEVAGAGAASTRPRRRP